MIEWHDSILCDALNEVPSSFDSFLKELQQKDRNGLTDGRTDPFIEI